MRGHKAFFRGDDHIIDQVAETAVFDDLLDVGLYLALVPRDEDGDEFVILKVAQDENGEDMLVTIDDDDEFDKVADIFDDMLFEDDGE